MLLSNFNLTNPEPLSPLLKPTGSPLGLFLALRQVNPAAGRALGTPEAAALMPGAMALLSKSKSPPKDEKGKTTPTSSSSSSSRAQPPTSFYYDGLPACRRMYNLYHPFDPIAYRV